MGHFRLSLGADVLCGVYTSGVWAEPWRWAKLARIVLSEGG
jgi:hypothetical protein